MRRLLLTACVLILLASSVSAQTVCPAGKPSAPWPGPAFVPTADCQGWVPNTHPLAASVIPPPSGVMPSAALVGQSIYAGLEGLPAQVSASAGGIRGFRGWAVDCALGSMPPVLRLTEQKPDGSTRDVPLDYLYEPTQQRADIQGAIGSACPAVYSAPASNGIGLGPNTQFGWSVALRSPILEVGQHTFTAVWTWPAQGHSGSTSVTVTIVP